MTQSYPARRSGALILLALILLIAGCGRRKQEHVTAAGGGKKYGGRFTVNVVRGSPNALDPVLISNKNADDIATQIFDHLVDLNDRLELVPELAKHLPRDSADGRIYRFDLRTDVYFQDDSCFAGGKWRKMTARDVKYSFERCCDPRTHTVALWAFKGKVKGATEYFQSIEAGKPIAGVEGFKVLDDSTFVIELAEPYAPFLYYLVNALGDVVPREAVEHYGTDFFRHPVGTGPYTLASWDPAQDLVLKRNPKYWGADDKGNRLPFVDEIRFRFIKDDKVQFNEFLSGSLDEAFGIPTEMYAAVLDPKTMKAQGRFAKYQVLTTPAMLTVFFDFNNTQAPFNNVDVRRAFNYAVDREKIVRFVLQNSPYAPAVHGLVPPVFPGYPTDQIPGFTFDPAKAKQLLAKAGYPDGKGFPTITLHVYEEPRMMQVAEAVQGMLGSALNVKVDIQVLTTAQLLDQSEAGKLLFWGTKWFGDYPDAETFLNLVYGDLVPTSSTLPSYPNSSRFNSPRFNELFRKGVSTIDFVARMRYYAEAEKAAIADAPVLPLFYERHFRLLQPYVRDYALDPMARMELKYVWLDK